MANNNTWVKHFEESYATKMQEEINRFCRVNRCHPISISVIHHSGYGYTALVVLEADVDG